MPTRQCVNDIIDVFLASDTEIHWHDRYTLTCNTEGHVYSAERPQELVLSLPVPTNDYQAISRTSGFWRGAWAILKTSADMLSFSKTRVFWGTWFSVSKIKYAFFQRCFNSSLQFQKLDSSQIKERLCAETKAPSKEWNRLSREVSGLAPRVRLLRRHTSVGRSQYMFLGAVTVRYPLGNLCSWHVFIAVQVLTQLCGYL